MQECIAGQLLITKEMGVARWLTIYGGHGNLSEKLLDTVWHQTPPHYVYLNIQLYLICHPQV